MSICVAYNLYKLMHVSKHLHCYKLFAIMKSIVYLVSHEFVCAINLISENYLKWPFRAMNWLKSWTQFCQKPSAIDCGTNGVYGGGAWGFS